MPPREPLTLRYGELAGSRGDACACARDATATRHAATSHPAGLASARMYTCQCKALATPAPGSLRTVAGRAPRGCHAAGPRARGAPITPVNEAHGEDARPTSSVRRGWTG